MFDRRPKTIKKTEHEKWARERLRRLRVACEKQHGTAIDAFVTEVIKQGETAVGKALVNRMEEFLVPLKTLSLAPEVAHAAKNFALLYAAGFLAIEAGILPWSKLDLEWAILKKTFRLAYPEAVDWLKQGKYKLRKVISSPTLHPKAKGSYTSPNDKCIGYVAAGGMIRIHSKSFKIIQKVVQEGGTVSTLDVATPYGTPTGQK